MSHEAIKIETVDEARPLRSTRRLVCVCGVAQACMSSKHEGLEEETRERYTTITCLARYR